MPDKWWPNQNFGCNIMGSKNIAVVCTIVHDEAHSVYHGHMTKKYNRITFRFFQIKVKVGGVVGELS